MNKFKQGDKVRCLVDHPGDSFTKDKIYIVGDLSKAPYPNDFLHIEKDNNGHENGMAHRWFELAYIKEFSDKLKGILNE